jgi:hypothetical protein
MGDQGVERPVPKQGNTNTEKIDTSTPRLRFETIPVFEWEKIFVLSPYCQCHRPISWSAHHFDIQLSFNETCRFISMAARALSQIYIVHIPRPYSFKANFIFLLQSAPKSLTGLFLVVIVVLPYCVGCLFCVL